MTTPTPERYFSIDYRTDATAFAAPLGCVSGHYGIADGRGDGARPDDRMQPAGCRAIEEGVLLANIDRTR